ncbi:hypothetical protein IMSAG049_00519 [Clostridiales bacterium]|jgi:hypothetical protein|nr:hypothetical protein [Lachnospiraceae bacterium]GFI61361.1 hypothetical protein IMSAG049_00519 [Clostridiales bacterium]
MMKNNMYKVLAAACAMAVVVASPAMTMTTHAHGFNINAGEDNGGNVTVDDNYWDNYWSDSSSSNDGGSSSSEPSYDEPTFEEPSAPSEAPSYSDNSASGSNVSSSNSNGGAATAPRAAGNANSKTVNVEGGQKFKIVMNADHTAYQVYHCGINRATFNVADKEGNAVAFSTVALEKGEDGLWYANIKFAEGVDTTGFTVSATAGDATYLYTELGVSGIKVNGVAALSTVPVVETK